MANGNSSIPPFHSLPFSAYYRTECQDKYNTSKLAHHVAYFDNECASSLQLTPCLDFDEQDERKRIPSYDCRAFVHGSQYSRKVRCFAQWGDAAGFANSTILQISKTIQGHKVDNSSKV